jgi:predicted nucleotidyltransferase
MNRDVFLRIKAITKRWKKEFKAKRVILFGSYANGKPTRDSDIDLLIIAPTKERFYQRMATALRIVRDLYYKLPISPIVLRPDELERRKGIGDQFLLEILQKGLEI